MRLLYLLLISVFIFGCTTQPAKDETKVNYFREDVSKLTRAGLLKNIPAAKLDSMVAIYSKDSLNGLKELLAASGDLLKVNVKLNGRTLQQVYQQICDTIGMKYPALKSDEVQTTIIPYKPGKNDTESVLVRVRFGPTWYERKLYYFDYWQVDDFIYRLYNRKLADDGQPARLHFVQYQCPDCAKNQDDFMGTTDVNRYAYMMLTKAQEDSLFRIPALEVEQEFEFNIYTTAEMDAQLQKFEASGLSDVIGAAQYEKVKTDVMQSALYSQNDLYDFMDTLFSFTIFDTTNPVNPYEEILNSLAKISRGKFTPSFISDEEASRSTRNVSFTYETDVYNFEAQQHGAYLFPGIIDNVNKALADHKAGGAFYTVLTEENSCKLIYIEDALLEKVKASGFFAVLEKGASEEIKSRWTTSR